MIANHWFEDEETKEHHKMNMYKLHYYTLLLVVSTVSFFEVKQKSFSIDLLHLSLGALWLVVVDHDEYY